jgi:hypothetical protein
LRAGCYIRIGDGQQAALLCCFDQVPQNPARANGPSREPQVSTPGRH